MNLRFYTLIFYRVLPLLLFFILFTNRISAQNDKFKALFMYNFTRYVEWPENKSTTFKIMVLGSSGLCTELKEIASKKTVGTKNILAIEAKSVESISDCQIVFIAKNHIAELDNVLKKFKNSHTLIITEAENGCLQGAGINFITKNGNLNFEISKTNISASGLIMSSNLASMGIVIN